MHLRRWINPFAVYGYRCRSMDGWVSGMRVSPEYEPCLGQTQSVPNTLKPTPNTYRKVQCEAGNLAVENAIDHVI